MLPKKNNLLNPPSNNRLLVVAPHTDDAEVGCGGTIARFLEENVDVCIVVFSTAKDSLPDDMEPDTLLKEFLESMEILGITRNKIITYDYPVRNLSYHRQEILEELIKVRREFSPIMVFAPSAADLHQDHQVIHAECLRAFRDLTLWGYELPWNHITFSTQAFVKLKARHLQKKWEAMQAYHSQIKLMRPYFTIEFIESLARIRGLQIKSEFAEAFDVTKITY